MNVGVEQNTPWICDKCNKKLELRTVNIRYLSGLFEVELLQCPQCNTVFIGEDLALGKMLDVESSLEDK